MTAVRLPVRVVKVGGSLFTWPELPEVLNDWLKRQEAAATVLLAGGGPLADFIRQMDQIHSLGQVASHWLCVDLLAVSSRFLATMMKFNLVDQIEQLPWKLHSEIQRKTGRGICVLNPEPFLRRVEPQLGPPHLPACWEVTSDSIAARICQCLPGDELVLLKSAPSPKPGTLQSAAEGQFVDAYFPTAAAVLPKVRCVNLRAAPSEETVWRPNP